MLVGVKYSWILTIQRLIIFNLLLKFNSKNKWAFELLKTKINLVKSAFDMTLKHCSLIPSNLILILLSSLSSHVLLNYHIFLVSSWCTFISLFAYFQSTLFSRKIQMLITGFRFSNHRTTQLTHRVWQINNTILTILTPFLLCNLSNINLKLYLY